MKKQEKSFFVKNLAQELKEAKGAFLVNYSGLSVINQQELKRRLREAGARMIVVKNTLLALAGKKAKIPKETLTDTILTGQTALVVAEDDPLAPLSVLAEFAKEFETPQLKVGIVEGLFQDKEALVALSKVPSKDALWGQVLGALMSFTYGLTATLEANSQQLLFILNEKSKSQATNTK